LPNEAIKEILIYNQLGQQIAIFTFNTFDISNFEQGIYFFKISLLNNNKTYINKIIKK
jgi:hypothetical protein